MSKDRSSLMSQTNINNASNTVIHINDGQSMQPFNDNESATKDVINVRWGCTLSPQKSPCALKLKKDHSKAVSCTYCNRNNIFEYYYCDNDKCIMCLICGAEQPITPPHTPIRGTNTHSKRQKTRKRTLSLSVLGDEPDNKRRKYGMDAELKGEDFDELNDYTDGMMNCLNDMKEYNYNLKKRFMEYTKNKQSEIEKWKQKYQRELEAKDRNIYGKNERIGELEGLIQQLYDEQKKHDQKVEEKNKKIKKLTDAINWWKNHDEEMKQLLDDEQENRKQIVGRKNKEIKELKKEKDKDIKELKQKIENLRNENKNVENFKKNVRKWTKLGDELQLFNADD